MGKDQTDQFHRGNETTTGSNKGEGFDSLPGDQPDQHNHTADGYAIDADELSPDIQLRHRNRNASKGDASYKNRENKSESDKVARNTLPDDVLPVVVEELPGILSRDLFTELAIYKADPCISLFINTHSSGVQVNEHYDPISFKNKLQAAGKSLAEKGMEADTIEQMLQPGYDLLKDDNFWNRMTHGLAVFIANGFFKYIKMPVAPTEDLVIEKSFYVTPLVPVIVSKEYFYLLVISKHKTKLFRADAFGMEQVQVAVPESVGEIKRLSDSVGGNTDEKTNVAVYFESIDDIYYKEIFNKENAPLLLAGVEYLIPIYKSVCDYHNVCEVALTGSHEHTEHNELYRLAKDKMEPYFLKRLEKALVNYGNQSATELTSSSVTEVIAASYYGRVSHLFVAKGEHIWGTFDEMANEIKLAEANDREAEDLIDNAVVKTLATGGEVFVIDQAKMPAASPIAAIFRYLGEL